jgi:outer membrane protein OmpA-like peptidoglycan-associated protein
LDQDGDGVPDSVDRCPLIAGIPTADPMTNGCPAPADADADGIPDTLDRCPNVAGVAQADPNKNGCPPDADGDGIPDAQDACPGVMGVASTDPAKNGCPSDKDGDGVLDDVDACPDEAGPQSATPEANGCPDTDADGIPNKVDACPEEPGTADTDPTKHGCKHRVVVSASEIVINEQVQFATGSAVIKSASDGLLDDVAKVLIDNPRIKKLEVQGHTDSDGSASLNKRLSQQRAQAVMAALVKRGVAADRLEAKGYGMEKPIGDNGTKEGKAANRRVQFIILQQDAAPARPSAVGALTPKVTAPPAPAPPDAAAPKAPAAPKAQ